MKNMLVAFCFLAIPFLNPLSAQSLDQDNGILGYRLGYPPDSMLDIRRDGKSQRLMRYRPVEFEQSLGEIPLKSVRLFFWEDKLHSIEVKTSGTNSDALRDWLANRYGEGSKEDAMGFRFSWEGAQIRVFFEQNIISHDALTTFVDDEVHERYYRYMHRLKYGGE